MKQCLTFISIALFLFLNAEELTSQTVNQTSDSAVVQNESAIFRTVISFGKNSVTGLLITKKTDENTLCGSFTNEFGVKGFDFRYNNRRTDLVYLMPFLDRFFIRKTLRKDISVLSEYGLMHTCELKTMTVQTQQIILYPVKGKNRYGKKISLASQSDNNKLTLVLRDLKHGLTINLVSINADGKQ